MVEYIERETMLSLYEGEYDTVDYHVPIPVLIQNIKDIPAADVRPVVRGRWIVGKIDDPILEPVGISESFRCSECDYGYVSFDQKRHNYCPNCGADMRGGDAE